MNEAEMHCAEVQTLFSGYLDGAISGREMQAVAAHLQACADCDAEFTAWRGVQRALAAAGPVKAPRDLAARLRLAIAEESARQRRHWWDAVTSRWESLLQPALLRVSGGLAAAVLLLGSIGMLVGVVAAPEPVLAHDDSLGALTSPHFLYSAARPQPVTTPEDTTIVVQADVNAAGEVFNYSIISGPADAATDAQVRNQLLLQVYEPARVFGEPVRGQVLITFSGVSGQN